MFSRRNLAALVLPAFLASPALGDSGFQGHTLDHNLVFPIMVMGAAGFIPRIVLFNPQPGASVSGVVYFFDQDGNQLRVFPDPMGDITTSGVNVSLPPGGSHALYVFPDTPDMTIGWALFDVAAPASGQLDVRTQVSGSVLTGYMKGDGSIGSVGVVAANYEPGKPKRISIPVTVNGAMNTAVALVNAGTQPMTVACELRGGDGLAVQTTTANVPRISPLAPGHQAAMFVTEMFPDFGFNNNSFDGSLVITTDQEGLEVVGLVDVDGTLTSIPTVHSEPSAATASWRATSSGLTDLNILDLATDPAHPDTIYAATDSRGAFKTTNGGTNWSPTGLENLGVNLLAVDPGDSNTVYAGTRGNGLFRSTDAGSTWTKVDVNVQFVDLLTVDAANPGTVFVANFSIGFLGQSVLFKSTDRGASWAPIKLPKSEFLAIAPSNSNLMYTTYSGMDDFSTLYKSTNGGATFGQISGCCHDTGYIDHLVIDPTDPNTLYAQGSGNPALKSTDGGATWKGIDVAIAILMQDNAGTLYGESNGFVYLSTDRGVTWNPFIQGLVGKKVQTLVISRSTPTTLYAGTNGNGVFKFGP